MSDPGRLREAFRDPALGWIVERLRRRLEQGRPLRGTATLRAPSDAERAAFERLLGHPPSRGPSRRQALTLRLEELEEILRHAGLADGLAEAVEALVGPVVDRRAERERLAAHWAEVFAEVSDPGDRPEVAEWLAERRTRTLVKRYSSRDPERGRRLLERSLIAVRALPVRGVPLAELAASLFGDSHALDAGQPLGTLAIAAAARIGGVDDWHRAEGRRDAWASVGVLLDELSAPVLTLNLRSAGDSLTDRVLALYRSAGEPCRLTTRQLLRHPPAFAPMARVYVCENPAVVAVAADRLGARCAPMVSVEGLPATASRVLLGQLVAAGAELVYHGDFDWGGVRIANLVIERHAARPWRFTVADYRRIEGGKKLTGKPLAAIWDSELETAMRATGRAVHEEQVLDELLGDLSDGDAGFSPVASAE